MKNSFHEGELVQVYRHELQTLSIVREAFPPMVREVPVSEYVVYSDGTSRSKSFFETLEGKLGLIVYVEKNKLDQVLGYRVLLEGKEVFIKSKVAEKYLKLVENQQDESGRPSKI
jgi:hypothetical protein